MVYLVPINFGNVMRAFNKLAERLLYMLYFIFKKYYFLHLILYVVCLNITYIKS